MRRMGKTATRLVAAISALLGAGATILVDSAGAGATAAWLPAQSLDGSANNAANPGWGRVGTNYPRNAPARYADGRSAQVTGPNSRYVSNRIFNDESFRENGERFAPNLLSENQVTQWGWAWGQFIDHTIGLVSGRGPGDPTGEVANIAVDDADPLEQVADPAQIPFVRSAPAAGTGVTGPRQQVNTVSSYIDGSAVYGTTTQRLEWLRAGPVDGDLSNNSAKLLLPGKYLPRRDARGNPAQAPAMDFKGPLLADPDSAIVSGDVRANNNMPVTAVQTLFAREHNRIVDSLPSRLGEQEKFEIARRVVIAELQYITYNEFLPAMGVRLPEYRGYDRRVNAAISDEFATVGFRVHSMIHDSIVIETGADRYTPAQIDLFRSLGILRPGAPEGMLRISVGLGLELENPGLLRELQLGPVLASLGFKPQYSNDEQIDNLLRNANCTPGAGPQTCVSDLAAIDLQRTRDHGMPTYNQLRRAYGLPQKNSFTAITGESTDAFPSDPLLTPGDEIDDPDSVDFTGVRTLYGNVVPLDQAEANVEDLVGGVRLTTVAARLRAMYGSVGGVEAYTGMLSEPHLPGSQLGELQNAIWVDQFRRLRDGDRFFYGNQTAALDSIKRAFGIDFRHNLGDLVAENAGLARADLPGNVFFVDGHVPAAGCSVHYAIDEQSGTGSGTFTATVDITNTGNRPLDGWTLRYRFLNGQVITGTTGGVTQQNGTNVPITNTDANATMAPGQTRTVHLSGTWSGANPRPAGYSLNTRPCASR